MSEGWAAWELPASEHLRTVGEILAAPESPEERRARRRVEAEAEARRASALDAADNTAAAGFMARLNGHAARDPLAAATAGEPFRDREAAVRRRAAIDALRPLGLADVITGGSSGAVLDANMGILEPMQDEAQRAELDRRYAFARSEREAEEGRAIVNRSRAQLAERYRALGLAERRRSEPASVLTPGSERAGGPERTFGPLNLSWSQVGPWLAQGLRP